MFRRRRPLMRAAVVGGSAFAAGRHMANNSNREAAQDEQISEVQQAQAAAPAPAPAAAAPAPTSETDKIAALSRLGDMLKSGVLTQAEFDVEKQKVLEGG